MEGRANSRQQLCPHASSLKHHRMQALERPRSRGSAYASIDVNAWLENPPAFQHCGEKAYAKHEDVVVGGSAELQNSIERELSDAPAKSLKSRC